MNILLKIIPRLMVSLFLLYVMFIFIENIVDGSENRVLQAGGVLAIVWFLAFVWRPCSKPRWRQTPEHSVAPWRWASVVPSFPTDEDILAATKKGRKE